MVRQDPRYRGPKEGNDTKRTYSIKAGTAQMSCSCYKNAWRGTTKKVFYGEFGPIIALKETKRNATKIPL